MAITSEALALYLYKSTIIGRLTEGVCKVFEIKNSVNKK